MFKTGTVFNAVFLLMLLFNLFSWFILPDNVAIHFGRGGVPDNWMSKGFHILMFTILIGIIYASFAIAPKLLDGVPKKYISLPNKDYWLTDENLPEAARRLSGLMYSFGIATGLLMLSALIMTVAANLSETVRLDEGILSVIFISYIVYTAWWCVKIFTAFRIPKG